MPELDLGNVKGPQGKSAYQSALDAGYSGSEEAFNTAMAKAPDAVLYTAQNLTDGQKAQARTNIGAAPDGFGLGGSATLLTSADNLDTLMKNGWYYYNTSNAPQGSLPTALASYATLVHVSATGNTCVQEAYDSSDNNLHGTVLRRTVYGLNAGAKIYPWEWVNPPINGNEYTMYRTTDRYKAQPTYRGILGDFEVWKPDSAVWPHGTRWGSAGKAMTYLVEAGETKNITLVNDQAFLVSWSDNVRQGLVVVQISSAGVSGITNVVAPQNWKIEAGTGLSVNVTELGGQWAGHLSVFMI